MAKIIRPSFIYETKRESRSRTLLYSPSLKSCIYSVDSNCLGVISNDFHKSVKRIEYWEELSEGNILALSSDGSLMAMALRAVRRTAAGLLDVHTFLSLYQLPNVINKSHTIANCRSFFMLPHYGTFFVSSLKFFPDGKRIIASLMQDLMEDERSGIWCRIYTIPENLWDEVQSATTSEENQLRNREFRTFEYEDIDVIHQHLMSPEIFENTTYEEIGSAECGFYSLAISPDTTRILTGSHDGEVFVFETSSLTLLQRVPAYEFRRTYGKKRDVRVISCHYNPVHAHQEFATCGHTFELKIWRVDELPDGEENAHVVHELPLEPKRSEYIGGCCCNYSPDGKLIAVTCEIKDEVTTSIVDSFSGKILYSLVYLDGSFKPLFPESFSLCHNMFVGNLCQVAAVSYDDQLCIWKLPVIYSLETLCFLLIKASVKYDDIDKLRLPSSLKLRLQYLYV